MQPNEQQPPRDLVESIRFGVTLPKNKALRKLRQDAWGLLGIVVILVAVLVAPLLWALFVSAAFLVGIRASRQKPFQVTASEYQKAQVRFNQIHDEMNADFVKNRTPFEERPGYAEYQKLMPLISWAPWGLDKDGEVVPVWKSCRRQRIGSLRLFTHVRLGRYVTNKRTPLSPAKIPSGHLGIHMGKFGVDWNDHFTTGFFCGVNRNLLPSKYRELFSVDMEISGRGHLFISMTWLPPHAAKDA